MGNRTNEDNWAARERLRRVEFLLWWRGWVGRADLTEGFGISGAQASGDLQRYAVLNPDAMSYHTRRKRYEAADGMRCVSQRPEFSEAVAFFLGSAVPRSWPETESGDGRLDLIALPSREVPPLVERRVMQALLGERRLRVEEFEEAGGRVRRRTISPRALAWSDCRWWLRAHVEEEDDWRFVSLRRIRKAEPPKDGGGELAADVDWETRETLRLRLHRGLPAARREALCLDHRIEDGRVLLDVRRALRPLLLHDLRVEGAASLTPDFELDEAEGAAAGSES